MKRLVLFIAIFLFFTAGIANAQIVYDFVSESTGSNGAFDPAQSTMLIVPPDGVFNFTTINIRTGVTVTFQKNAANTPVYMLATGDVTINGTIDVSGGLATNKQTGAVGGPGGFDGGTGGGTSSAGGKGLGPGGGEGGKNAQYIHSGGGGYSTAGSRYDANNAAGGVVYGNASIVPLIGGSGGGGSYGCVGSYCSTYGYGGGGGGGALLIASSGKIVNNGSIIANGGSGYSVYNYGWYNFSASGSGGAIKLMANEITGTGSFSARGGAYTPAGGQGRIRLEAYANSFIATDPQFTYGLPGNVYVTNSPSLNITTIAGQPVPPSPTGSYAQPDLILASTNTNTVSVEVAASNIPKGTTVKISVTPQYGAASSATAYLDGPDASSTSATANVYISTQYTNVIVASAEFTIQAMYWNGEKIETAVVSATPGGKSTVTYISNSGKRIKEEQLILAGLVRR